MRSELRLRFDYGHVVPWVRRDDGRHRRGRRTRRRVPAHPGRRCTGEDPRTVARPRPSARASRVPFVLTWRASHLRRRRARGRRTRPGRHRRASGGTGRRAARSRGPYRDAVQRSLHHAEGPDLRADRRHRRRRDDLAARADRRPAQLGLPLLLAARRHLHAAGAARRGLRRGGQRRGASGCCGRSPGDPSQLQIMYGLDGTPPAAREPSCRGCRATRAPPRCGSATPPPTSSSSTCGARSSTVSPSRAPPGWPATDDSWDLQVALMEHLEGAWQRARQRAVGDARAPPPLHPLQGHGLGRGRPHGQRGVRSSGLPGPGRPLGGAARRRSAPTSWPHGFDADAGHVHPVLRQPGARRQPAAHPARRLPALRRPAGRRRPSTADPARAHPGRPRPALPHRGRRRRPPRRRGRVPRLLVLARRRPRTALGRARRGRRAVRAAARTCATTSGCSARSRTRPPRPPPRQHPAGLQPLPPRDQRARAGPRAAGAQRPGAVRHPDQWEAAR